MADIPLPGQPQDTPRPPFSGAAQPNRVTFTSDALPPPSDLYIQRDDVMVVQWMSSIPGQVLNVNIRLLEPGRVATQPQPAANLADYEQPEQIYGSIMPITQQQASPTGYVMMTMVIPMAEGFLLSVGITGLMTAATRGQTFARALIARGGLTTAATFLTLVGDYVTSSAPIGWPNGRVIHPTEGPGNYAQYNLGATALGTDWVFTPNLNTRVRIHHLVSNFAAAVAAANRQIQIAISNPALPQNLYIGGPNQNVVALGTAQVVATDGQPSTTLVTTLVSVPLPNPAFVVSNAFYQTVLRSLTLGLQAGDQFASTFIEVEEWLDF